MRTIFGVVLIVMCLALAFLLVLRERRASALGNDPPSGSSRTVGDSVASGFVLPTVALLAITPPAIAAPPEPLPVTSAAPVTAPREPEGLAKLSDYIFEGMATWKKPGKDAVAYADVARDIAWESLEREPLPPLRGAACARGTILLATLAYFEGGLLSYVDDGRVNSGKWREQAFKNGITWSPNISDDGEAFSLWQIHPEKGILFTPNGEMTWNEGAATDTQGMRKPGVITGPDLTKNRRLAVRVAIAFLRKSIRLTHGLVGYTGETAKTGFGKASARELFAANWCKRHPFTP